MGTACPGKLLGEPSSQREVKLVSQSNAALPSKIEIVWVEAQIPETVPTGLPGLTVKLLSRHTVVSLDCSALSELRLEETVFASTGSIAGWPGQQDQPEIWLWALGAFMELAYLHH